MGVRGGRGSAAIPPYDHGPRSGSARGVVHLLVGDHAVLGLERHGLREADRAQPRRPTGYPLACDSPTSHVTVWGNSRTITRAMACMPMNGRAPRWMSSVWTSGGFTLWR